MAVKAGGPDPDNNSALRRCVINAKAVNMPKDRVEAAIKSRELAERTLDAEQKKYQLGASTIFFVIQAQRDLAAAQSAEVSSLVALTKSKVDFEKALG